MSPLTLEVHEDLSQVGGAVGRKDCRIGRIWHIGARYWYHGIPSNSMFSSSVYAGPFLPLENVEDIPSPR